MSNPTWRKSSFSGSSEPDCVEVAGLRDGIGLRDSKNVGSGHLTVSVESFAALVRKIKNG